MQAAADSLALAGARELNKEAGAESRAISAMANVHAAAKTGNTVFGVGSSPTLTFAYVFYSSLSAASEGIGGAAASGDSDAKYVAVKVTPQSWSTIFPVTFLANNSTNEFTAGTEAVGGYAGTTVCSVAPIFICNPYEASSGSMTDAQATAARHASCRIPQEKALAVGLTIECGRAEGSQPCRWQARGRFAWFATLSANVRYLRAP
jgi:hypothetical protein